MRHRYQISGTMQFSSKRIGLAVVKLLILIATRTANTSSSLTTNMTNERIGPATTTSSSENGINGSSDMEIGGSSVPKVKISQNLTDATTSMWRNSTNSKEATILDQKQNLQCRMKRQNADRETGELVDDSSNERQVKSGKGQRMIVSNNEQIQLVQTCPKNFPDIDVKKKCEDPPSDANILTLKTVFPVIVLSTDLQFDTILVFTNMFCAQCNKKTKFSLLNATLMCTETQSAKPMPTDYFLRSDCRVVFNVLVDKMRLVFDFDDGAFLNVASSKRPSPNCLKNDTRSPNAASNASNQREPGYNLNDITDVNETQVTKTTDNFSLAKEDCNSSSHFQEQSSVLLLESCHAQAEIWRDQTRLDNVTSEIRLSWVDNSGLEDSSLCTFQGSSSSEKCLSVRRLFRDVSQRFEIRVSNEGNVTNEDPYSAMTACLNGLEIHLAGMSALISGVQVEPGDHEDMSTLDITVRYGKLLELNHIAALTFGDVLPYSVYSPGSSFNCTVERVSIPMNCDMDNSQIEKEISSRLNETADDSFSPCSSLGQTIGMGPGFEDLKCSTFVQLDHHHFYRVNGSTLLGIHNTSIVVNTSYYFRQDDLFWVCYDVFKNKHYRSRVIVTRQEFSPGQGWATLVCTIISLVCLAITFLSKCPDFFSLSLPIKLMLNLMVCLFISQLLLLLMGIEDARFCTVVAILSHYSWLSTFFWMAVCAFHMQHTFCNPIKEASFSNSSSSKRKRLILYSAVGYGFPLLIVCPTVAIDFCLCTDMSVGYGNIVCFIYEPMANLATFAGPIAFILVVNAFLFGRTFYQIRKTANAVRDSRDSNICNARIFMKIASLFGFTWVFGYLAAATNVEVLWYFFVVLNSLQGLYIFLAFGLHGVQQQLCKISIIKNRRRSDLTNSTKIPESFSVSLPASGTNLDEPDSPTEKEQKV